MTEPTLDELIADFKGLRTSNHAHAVGHLCLTWNVLENVIDIFLGILTGLSGSEIHSAVINNADARDKLRMLDATGFIKRPNDDWYERLKSNLNRIDNELRTERNRSVHDQWIAVEDEIIRRTPMGKIVKEQARQLAFKSIEEKPIDEKEVWELVVSVSAITGYLIELLNEYINRNAAQPPSPDKPD